MRLETLLPLGKVDPGLRTPLNVTGEHYNLNLMVPLFNPGPIEHPDIPIHLAAVKPIMSRIAGEVADGIRPHPVCTPSYIKEVMLPAVREGARRTGRNLEHFEVCMKPLVASARTETELQAKIRDARARIAFYASTPAYQDAFTHLGLDDVSERAQSLSREQRWEELPDLISDEILDQFAVIGTYDQIGQKVFERWGNTVSSVEFSITVNSAEDRETLAEIARVVQGSDDSAAKQLILGADV